MIQSLQNDIPSTVKVTKFRSKIFPRPGCDAEGVTFTTHSLSPGTPPLVSVQKMTIRARYLDLFARPGYVARIVLDGMRVNIPPRVSSDHLGSNRTGSTSSKDMKRKGSSVGEIVANGTVLEIGRSDSKPPLRFDIHRLTVNSVGRESRMTYHVEMRNAEPPGEIRSTGSFGPWKSGEPGQTPLSGSYSFQEADLSVFKGIAGKLSSEDKFNGVLGQINVLGSADVPDFKLTQSTHAVHLQTQFHLLLNAINGDVQLENIKAGFLQTTVVAHGKIAGAPNRKGKTTSIDLTVNDGRVQNILELFGRSPKPPMSGITSLQARAVIPPEAGPFLKKLTMQGSFTINDGYFSNSNTQDRVSALSARASGMKQSKDSGNSDAQNSAEVVSEVQGHAVVRNGIADFRNLSFTVPGAHADMNGTYNLITEGINFHGTLKTDASFSKTAGGVKSVLLKPFDLFFKKKPSGAEIPVHMTGTYSAPQFGIDIVPDHKSPTSNQSRQ